MADSLDKAARRRELNGLAKRVADLAKVDVAEPVTTEDGRDLAAVMLGRRGGLKGGRARADSMSAERRSEIARTAAAARWAKR